MTAGLFARVPTIAALVVAALLATATLTLAATSSSPQVTAAPAAEPELATLVVPDVRGQVYVFAKGALDQAGFAWKVVGPVQGYAANVVAAQTPVPGTRVLADGSPIVRLSLSKNPSYTQEGIPENESPYAGRPVRLLGSEQPRPSSTKPAAPKPAVTKPAAKPVAKPAVKQPASRKAAFALPGAPPEPLDEASLVVRVDRLDAWLDSHRTPTRDAVGHWLYQHNWVVTGAAFGWSGGAAALKALVAVDRRVQKLWGIGTRSEAVARKTLAEVERKVAS